ncbi:redoxin domain-containing protein [Dethiothermospora halolimnae]|uniref:TlpA family protein disulfide reductase n=1 Tax=Dethiothermospora halolimnae TaxID=3114390 RepID=UPI003CCC16B1
MKRIVAILLSIIMILSLAACGGSKDTLSEEEKKELGYKKYQDLGLEFKMGDVWDNADDNLTLGGLGDPENEKEPIYGGLDYGFISNELINEYNDIKENVKDEDERRKKLTEVFSKVKDLFSYVIIREDKLPDDEKLSDLTGKRHNEKIDTIDGLVFYFSYDEYDDEGLSEEAKKMYKSLYDDLENVRKSTIASKPITAQDAITGLKNLDFKVKDLDGNEVSSDIFKDNKLTMVNIWGTFCGPCIKEMPDLEALHQGLGSKGVKILGIIGDIPVGDDEETVKRIEELKATANKIIETKKVTFTNLIPDEYIRTNLVKSIAGFPTSFFVDGDGKIVGKVITGSRSKEEYEEIIMETLESIEK